MRPDT